MPGVRRAGAAARIALAMVALTATPSWAGQPMPEPPPPYHVQPWTPRPSAPWLSAGGYGRPHGPAEGAAPSRPRPQGPVRASARSRVITAVNQYRRQAGCHSVSGRRALHRAAAGHSAHLSRLGRLSHRGRGGTSPGDRVRAAGYRPGMVGENLVAGPAGPFEAVRSWMRSAPHRAIILGCRYSHAGVGVARGRGGPWWTLVMASRR
ncbi:CAP domain-containing protein [Streptomyces abyssomicinicus]|uniref:CAP domain-containing protein n=1 Tax=Streptomyces abyssomicinicus TaxID=574929 RepID=UPI00124FCB3F|nr:CAP domain-containing protein [Streptomyces abyssomicinicus]